MRAETILSSAVPGFSTNSLWSPSWVGNEIALSPLPLPSPAIINPNLLLIAGVINSNYTAVNTHDAAREFDSSTRIECARLCICQLISRFLFEISRNENFQAWNGMEWNGASLVREGETYRSGGYEAMSHSRIKKQMALIRAIDLANHLNSSPSN